jgi:hypothetical protein
MCFLHTLLKPSFTVQLSFWEENLLWDINSHLTIQLHGAFTIKWKLSNFREKTLYHFYNAAQHYSLLHICVCVQDFNEATWLLWHGIIFSHASWLKTFSIFLDFIPAELTYRQLVGNDDFAILLLRISFNGEDVAG